MAEKRSFARYNTRYGLILRSTEKAVKLNGFEIPPLDKRFKLISAKEINEINHNQISMFGGSMPLLAEDIISYIGQPLLALFGPDYESVELILKQIKINTEPLTEEEILKRSKENKKFPDLEYSWGKNTVKDLSNYKTVESNFNYSNQTFISEKRYLVTAWEDGKDMHIECPMQWPELIKRSIEKCTGWSRKNIVLHSRAYNAIRDEYLLMPALYSSIAALGLIATESPIELRAVGESARAGINVKRKSFIREAYTDQEGQFIPTKIIAEQVDMTIDQGAYLFASDEFERQAMAGLLPAYSVDRFLAKIHVVRSFNHPASFCGSLGYSEALASSEYHSSCLADYKTMTPFQMQEALNKDKTKFTSYAPSVSISEAKKNTEHIFDSAAYNRKWISNALQKGDFGLVGYLRGIGMASGMGIAGFSSRSCLDSRFTSVMTYTNRHNVTLNSSAPKEEYWKNIILDIFNKGEKKKSKKETKTKDEDDFQYTSVRSRDSLGVIFQDLNQETADSGPDVLSRFTCCFPNQLEKACQELNEAKNVHPAPVSVRFDAEGVSESTEFSFSGYGTIIVELFVNKEDYQPEAREIWASFCFTKLPKNQATKQTVKQTILNTLSECGIKVTDKFQIHVDYTISKTNEEDLASIKAIASGLTMAACANALYQIGGEKGAKLPTNATLIEEVTKNGARS